jgi:Zn-dependent M28 family amino/carboxypeptidase
VNKALRKRSKREVDLCSSKAILKHKISIQCWKKKEGKMRNKISIIQVSAISIFAVLISVSLVSSAVRIDTSELREAVTVDGVRVHQAEFQAIADDNGGTRVSGSPGYDDSVAYIVEQMTGAGYDVTVQEFEFPFFEVLSQSFFQTASIIRDFDPFDFSTFSGDFDVMTFSGSGSTTDTPIVATNDVIVPFPPVPNTSTSGCEPEDFLDGGSSLVAGKVALIQRGTCTFALKALNAEAAGAVAAVIFNEGQPDFNRDGVVFGTLGAPGSNIPVVGISYDLGVEFLDDTDPRVSIDIQTLSEIQATANVLAETREGRDDRVVVVGAHLDSVLQGPGIQDNGSGSAAILEVALQMAELEIVPRNKVRFAWWGAEESGLVGSSFYVSTLSKRDIKNTALNLNFDMIGSPNFVRFVYDGDGSATPLSGPNGSANIENVFLDYFAEQGLETEPTAFDGRSDYGPFIDAGIPAGGLFTGAEEIKTAEQAAIYGGTAGEQYDPCYHLACDTFDNISLEVLDQNADAIAHAVLTFAMTTSSVNGTDKGKGHGQFKNDAEFWGPRNLK